MKHLSLDDAIQALQAVFHRILPQCTKTTTWDYEGRTNYLTYHHKLEALWTSACLTTILK